MNRRLALGALACGVAACAPVERPRPPVPAPRALPPSPPGAPACDDAFARGLFREHGVEGAFVLHQGAVGRTLVANAELAGRGQVPASTFKLPNTLIGLETGVITGERFALRWDGTRRDVDAWNRDHDLASALKNSVVWFYQEVARRVGEARMRQYVEAFDYGNHDIGGGIDHFWLDGRLRISPFEQVDFLRRLRAGALPVRPEHVALLRRLVVLDEAEGAVLRGKTGLEVGDRVAVGWLVGDVERGGGADAYALLVLAAPAEAARLIPLRQRLVRRLLAHYGSLPASMAG